MARLKAFGIHLLISLIVLAGVSVIFVFSWFPQPYFFTEGGWRVLRLIIGVDAILGPALTLIIYNSKKTKRALAIDFTIIAFLQLFALSGGLFTIYGQRTVAVIEADGFFYSLDETTVNEIPAISQLLKNSSGLLYAAAALPIDVDERQNVRYEVMSSGKPIYAIADNFIPLGEAARKELEYSVPDLTRLLNNHEESIKLVDLKLRKLGKSREQMLLFPVLCKEEKFLLLIDKETLTVAGWVRGVEISSR